ncbi:GH19500 [Drosophila grimshawi]|uniref:GH19500 n=1 Tax=Drosophila grimshawi TaxID=7222 RepID=B4JGX1_DROGR|nr:GH19500 [Drosophila grimshawi]
METESMEQDVMLDGNEDLMSTSNTSTNGGAYDTNGCAKKTTITSPDRTSYVAKARVTRPTPPPPSKNPMQFVQSKPCNLYQTAQQQLKKAEEVKKLKEVQKEEPEEWQNNLDNWKSSRRKRVEHIIDRAVETKKLELEEHDRMRRKSKTFTEMMEERAERGPRGRVKLANLAVYNEDEANDLSDLGIGTSSASGKSSLSEDYDNNSVMSDNADLDRAIGSAGAGSIEQQQNHINRNRMGNGSANQASTSNAGKVQPVSAAAAATREYISSPGYDTSSSTAPASSPDPCEYTYEGAIQDYKQRVQRASSNGKISNNNASDNGETIAYPTRRGSKIEDRLSGFEVTSPSDTQEGVEKQKVDVPKVDISKRKEIFEQRDNEPKPMLPNGAAPKVVLRDRLHNGNGVTTSVETAAKQETKRLSGDISSIRDRMQSLEHQRNAFNSSKSVDVPVPPLKQRLNSLQYAVTKEEEQHQKKPPLVALIDARQLEIMRGEEQRMRQQQQQQQQQQLQKEQLQQQQPLQHKVTAPPALVVDEPPSVAHDDSGIQADNNEELLKDQQQQQQLNEAIAALALEERQLEEAANAVNQIEAEFDELTDLHPAALPAANSHAPKAVATATSAATSAAAAKTTAPQATMTTAQPAPAAARDMEFSVSSTNNFLESAMLSPRSVSDDNVVVASVSNAVSGQPKQIIYPNPYTNPNPNPNPSQNNCNLRRKPSNEMVHARNLLKMFKDTFQNDDELSETAEQTLSAQSPPPGQFSQVFDFTKKPSSPIPAPAPAPTPIQNPEQIPHTQIPRPLGKPPMSPKAVRSKPTNTPQQFSINGRVEIFNSRQLDKPPTPPPRRAFRAEPEMNSFSHGPQTPIHVPEVVMCAPPVTIVPAEELPKPNTVKALSSCFGESATARTSPTPLPKPLARSRIPQITPPASPKPNRRTAPAIDVVEHALSDRSSGDYAPIMGQTQAVVHTPPVAKVRAKPPPSSTLSIDPLAPNDSLHVEVTSPSEMPVLRICTPNESSLFKLAGSAPTSPGSADPAAFEVALCQQFLERESNKQQFQLPPDDLERLELGAVEEVLCDKLDVVKLPKLPSTGCQTISQQQLDSCDGIIKEQQPHLTAPKDEDVALCVGLLDCLAPAQEPSCESIDVRQKPVPATGYQDITDADIRRCDGWQGIKDFKSGNKPSSPIGDARAAHSKALMDTCEQIIAEERLASSQMMKTSLPDGSSTPGTPMASRKSKIPIPKSCCISASNTDSIGRTGYLPVSSTTEQPLIARTQVVETEINVKQMTPPSSPKAAREDGQEKNKAKEKKSKTNIFDFLRRNFGHHEESPAIKQAHPTLNETLEPKVVLTSTRSGVDVVNADEFGKADSSKFYLDNTEAVPPPLPTTPAPVNIEIRKTITTDEILEEHNTEQALSQEISDLLDDELNKLEAAGAAGAAVGAGR